MNEIDAQRCFTGWFKSVRKPAGNAPQGTGTVKLITFAIALAASVGIIVFMTSGNHLRTGSAHTPPPTPKTIALAPSPEFKPSRTQRPEAPQVTKTSTNIARDRDRRPAILPAIESYMAERGYSDALSVEPCEETEDGEKQRVVTQDGIFLFTVRDGKVTGVRNQAPRPQLPLPSRVPPEQQPTQVPSASALATRQVFDMVQIGMSCDEVVRIVGSQGELTSEYQGGTQPISQIFKWRGADHSAMTLSVMNG